LPEATKDAAAANAAAVAAVKIESEEEQEQEQQERQERRKCKRKRKRHRRRLEDKMDRILNRLGQLEKAQAPTTLNEFNIQDFNRVRAA
jgi:hypothetical protein